MHKFIQKSYPGAPATGFTLIELLVVVLIIGILAGVALPQYQKAVEKSRAAQALSVLHSLAQAQQSYYMANGMYAARFDDLDAELLWSGTEKWYNLAQDTRSNGDWSLQMMHDNGNGPIAIYIGRLKGKYKGGGFSVFLATPGEGGYGAGYDKHQVTCVERTGAGLVFALAEGNYCRGLFGGTFVAASGGTRQYRLP